jgi:hypothetical protein
VGTLASQCRALDALEDHLTDLLAKLIPKGLSKRRRQGAMAVVALPDHGSVDDAHHDEVCRSKAKSGTTHFFTDATAYAVVQGRRDTLARGRVRAKQTMDHVLRPLLARLGTLGIRIKLLLPRPGLLQRAGHARPEHGGGALYPASSHTRQQAYHAGWAYRHLCPGSRDAKPLDVVYLEESARGTRCI